METNILLVRFLKLSENCWITNIDSSCAGKFNAMLVFSTILQIPHITNYKVKTFFFYTSYNSDEHPAALIYNPFTSITLLL